MQEFWEQVRDGAALTLLLSGIYAWAVIGWAVTP